MPLSFSNLPYKPWDAIVPFRGPFNFGMTLGRALRKKKEAQPLMSPLTRPTATSTPTGQYGQPPVNQMRGGGSPGSYRGVAINPGDQASIIEQMRAIDARNNPSPTMPPANMGYLPPYTPPTTTGRTAQSTPQQAEGPTFSGILFDLIKKATEGNKNVEQARKDLSTFQQNTAQKLADIRSTPVALEFQQGRAQAVQQASAEKEKALATGVQNALEAQQQELSALQGAAGLATPQQLSPGNVYIDPLTGKPIAGGPTQVPYTNQFINPLTGQPVGGGASGGAFDVNSAAQQVLSGQMSPSQAYDLFGNNLYFNNQIRQAITKANPNFNFVQAEANAAAQGQALTQATERGGDLQKRGDTVLAHIGQLENAYDQIFSTRSPYLNIGLNYLRGVLPSKEFQDYLTALDNVRGELAGIFSVGGTPSEGEAMAKRILPDGATPAQIKGALQTARTLIGEKISSYSIPTPAQYGGYNPPYGGGGQGGGGVWDW